MSFEMAADAVVAGDLPTLRRLLAEDPGLVTARSQRTHHATLLHYCAANCVEQERQRTPANIVAIAQTLLSAGADVNATAEMYSAHDTTLSLAATSVHSERAGVQQPLLALLIAHGAELYPGDIAACLWNGRRAAAEFLARHEAPLSLPEAAGLGRLDLVQAFFAAGVSPQEMGDSLLLACSFGRERVLEYLAARGADLRATTRDGQTALHMAAIGAHPEIARMLLKLGADPSALNRYGATALGQAQWSADHSSEPQRFHAVIALLMQA